MIKASKKPESKEEQLLKRLIDYVEQNGIEVKYNRGNFRGGLVRYRENYYLYLNRKNDVPAKIQTILNEIENQKNLFNLNQFPEDLKHLATEQLNDQ